MSGVFYEDWVSIVPRKLIRHEGATSYHIALYAALGDFANEDRVAYPSRKKLAEIMECGVRKVEQVTADLVNWGFIRVEKRKGSAGEHNIYHLNTRTTCALTAHEMRCHSAPHAREVIPYEVIPNEDTAANEKQQKAELRKRFLEHPENGGKFANYGYQNKSLNALFEFAKVFAPGDELSWLNALVDEFENMRRRDNFWKKQPFLPSTVASQKTFEKIRLEMQQKSPKQDAINVYEEDEQTKRILDALYQR